MQTRKVSRDSWHYKIASGMGWKYYEEDHDWCLYCRRVFYGLMIWAILGLAGLFISTVTLYITGDFIGWLIAGLIHGFVMLEEGMALVIFSSIFALAAGAISFFTVGLPRLIQKVRNTTSEVEMPTIIPQDTKDFLKDAYRSFKDRFCYKVEVE